MQRAFPLTLLLFCCLGSLPLLAQEPQEGDRVGIHSSYGIAAEINGSVPLDLATLAVRKSWRIDGFRPFGGASSWGLEATFFAFDQEPVTPGFGLHALYELRAPNAPVTPVLRLGAGTLATTRRVPVGETHHNFSVLAGLGLEVAIGDAWLELGYRLHHVSNADTGRRNLGINAHSIVLGVSWGS